MKCLVCMLEEPSAEEMLKGLLPRILPKNYDVKYIVFEGKQDMEKQIERRLKLWQRQSSVFLVMRDQDAGNCYKIKHNLIQKVKSGGKSELTIVRIACRELESFYIGDLVAVEKALNIKGLGRKQKRRKFRKPDDIVAPAGELKKLTRNIYQKISGSRAIGQHLKIDSSNCSHSFNILIKGIQKLTKDY
ncbi:DUF4276 family protein [candidate division KSB1 bacterium]|nr:DUF4276 family protein [candidate division KSB1 bacterium]